MAGWGHAHDGMGRRREVVVEGGAIAERDSIGGLHANANGAARSQEGAGTGVARGGISQKARLQGIQNHMWECIGRNACAERAIAPRSCTPRTDQRTLGPSTRIREMYHPVFSSSTARYRPIARVFHGASVKMRLKYTGLRLRLSRWAGGEAVFHAVEDALG